VRFTTILERKPETPSNPDGVFLFWLVAAAKRAFLAVPRKLRADVGST
jgi:hypothetical protein